MPPRTDLDRATEAFWAEYWRHWPRDFAEHEDAVRAGIEAALAAAQPHGDHEGLVI